MTLYNIETAKGWVVCREDSKGVYHPIKEEDEQFLFEPILRVERIVDVTNVDQR